uniref:Uncharacterized protein n=1 Tax=Moniliophthora roreri TaxID=221103 RepID=A0A0W0FQJ1_MONRR
MFNDAQDVAISGNAVNVVHRDQYNGATINAQVIRIENTGKVKVEREKVRDNDSEYDQYREIIRGDIHKLEQLSSKGREDWEWKGGKIVWTHSYRVTAHRAQVYDDDRVFTAISYHGRGAEKIWKKEFRKWSQPNDPAVLLQLFAINRSKVPALLFHDEWLPLGHLHSKVAGTFWERYYLRVYADAWWRSIAPNSTRDLLSNLWLNSRTGRVSSGPDGPYVERRRTRVLYDCEDMPSAMEMAKGNTCVRFFSKTGAGNLDLDVLQYAYYRHFTMSIENLLGIESCCLDGKYHSIWRKNAFRGPWHCHFCDHIACDEVQDRLGKLRLDSVYSSAQLEKIAFLKQGLTHSWEASVDTLNDRTLIDSGLTRFQFNVGFQGTSRIYFDTSWLGDLSVVMPHLEFRLRIESRPEQFGVSALETLPIVYLFLRPPPPCLANIDSWLSKVSFWSFDKSGTSEIPETECKRLGLPNIIFEEVRVVLDTWPKYVYDAIHAWQVVRGFDPATVVFASSLRLPIFDPAMTRFEEIVEQEPLTCSSVPEPDVDSIHCDFDNHPSASSQASPLPTPLVTCISQRQAPRKRKRVQVVTIHDTDSESESESAHHSHQLSTLKRKRVKTVA